MRRPGRPADASHEITQLLLRWARGDVDAKEPLFDAVYAELRRLAGALVRGERRGHSFQPTELVHEAYLKLDASSLPDFESRRHYFGIAARAMRQLLVDYALARSRKKRPDPGQEVPLEKAAITPTPGSDEEVLAVHEALDWLAEGHPRYARVVELRYFGGLSLEETATVLGIGRATVARHWALARSLLQERMGRDGR